MADRALSGVRPATLILPTYGINTVPAPVTRTSVRSATGEPGPVSKEFSPESQMRMFNVSPGEITCEL